MAHMRNAFWCVEADLPMLAIAVRCEIRDEFGPFLNESYSLRTVRPESDTLPEYLQEALPNQPDSGNRWLGQ